MREPTTYGCNSVSIDFRPWPNTAHPARVLNASAAGAGEHVGGGAVEEVEEVEVGAGFGEAVDDPDADHRNGADVSASASAIGPPRTSMMLSSSR